MLSSRQSVWLKVDLFLIDPYKQTGISPFHIRDVVLILTAKVILVNSLMQRYGALNTRVLYMSSIRCQAFAHHF